MLRFLRAGRVEVFRTPEGTKVLSSSNSSRVPDTAKREKVLDKKPGEL